MEGNVHGDGETEIVRNIGSYEENETAEGERKEVETGREYG